MNRRAVSATEARPVVRLPSRLLAAVIRGYQRFVSPAFPPSCRFHPSCSQYALEAITRHGALKGSWLAVRRLAELRGGSR